jgi:hypothetical protein
MLCLTHRIPDTLAATGLGGDAISDIDRYGASTTECGMWTVLETPSMFVANVCVDVTVPFLPKQNVATMGTMGGPLNSATEPSAPPPLVTSVESKIVSTSLLLLVSMYTGWLVNSWISAPSLYQGRIRPRRRTRRRTASRTSTPS